MVLTLYHYDDSGVVTGQTTVRPDARFPGGYPEPAQSTRIAPVDDEENALVAAENEAIYFDGSAWSVVPDFRDQTYWMPDRTTQTKVTLGPLPDGATLTEPPLPPAEALAAVKQTALSAVDNQTGSVRLAYITDIPGQQMIYQAKEAEAMAFNAQDPVPTDLAHYPYIAAEAAALGVTALEVANTYTNLSAQWRAVGVQLEALRVSAKAEISAAIDEAGVEAAVANFNDTLSSLS